MPLRIKSNIRKVVKEIDKKILFQVLQISYLINIVK